MDRDRKGWFTEMSPMWPGNALSLQIKKEIFRKKSKYQDICIFESTHFGRVLLLDNIIQFTEQDEASYQEMITFLPLNSHPNPKKVLIIGGGDGGVARETTKHPLVKQIVQCEIDEEVIDACKMFVPSMACGFDSPKLKLLIDDGAKYLEETDEKFDVIITDASDPVVEDMTKNAPAASLFDEDYYEKMKDRLTDDGILCCQGENMWLHMDIICRLLSHCKKIFPVSSYAVTSVPTYPLGQIGFILCSKNSNSKLSEPVTVWNDEDIEKLNIKYYNSEIHRAAFVLPTFVKNKLKDI